LYRYRAKARINPSRYVRNFPCAPVGQRAHDCRWRGFDRRRAGGGNTLVVILLVYRYKAAAACRVLVS
jgi:hypothetical protein